METGVTLFLEEKFQTCISMISNSVTHLRSYTNTTIEGNSCRYHQKLLTSAVIATPFQYCRTKW